MQECNQNTGRYSTKQQTTQLKQCVGIVGFRFQFQFRFRVNNLIIQNLVFFAGGGFEVCEGGRVTGV